MLDENHPGPDQPEIRFITEAIQDVLAHIEARIAGDLRLFQFRIYARDVYTRWIEIVVAPARRNYRLRTPRVSQSHLSELWDSRREATLN